MDMKELLEDYKEYIKSDSFKNYLEEEIKKMEIKTKRVSSVMYLDWIYRYVSKHKSVDDESALYQYKGIDAENGELLSFFFGYVENLAKSQNVTVGFDKECEFYNKQIVVKIKDKYFELFQMYGQGAWTCISLLENEPDYAFVKL